MGESMKARHAAALALVGWYLLTPPVMRKGQIVIGGRLFSEEAPLSLWNNQASFDSATGCEAARHSPESFHAPASVDEKERRWVEENFGTLLQYAKCVSTDDPRLKPK